MASLAELWAQQQAKPTYDTSNPEVAPVQIGGSMDDVLYGKWITQKTFIDQQLAQIAQQAGLPANFDWKPYLAQVAQDGSLAKYSPFQNHMIAPLLVAQAAMKDVPQLQQVLPQYGEGTAAWQAGEQRADSVRSSNKSAGQVEAGVMAAAGGAFGAAALGAGSAGAAGAGGGAATETAALGSGISAGATGSGGLSATAGGASGISGAGASGALAPGFFGAETLAPVLGGLTASSGGSGGSGTTAPAGGGTAASNTALQRILDGSGTTADYLSLFGQVAPSLLGMYASNKQTDAYKEQAAKFEAMGAPYRSELAAISADPNKFYQGPAAQQGLEAVLRKLSVNGNPAGSPYSQSLALGSLYDKYGQERALLGNLGGLSAYNSAAPGAASSAINSGANQWNAAGYGLGQVLNPQRSISDIFREYQVAGGKV